MNSKVKCNQFALHFQVELYSFSNSVTFTKVSQHSIFTRQSGWKYSILKQDTELTTRDDD